MKTAIYIENGATQIVLTPECQVEAQALNAMCKQGVCPALLCRGGLFDHDATAYNQAEAVAVRSVIVRVAPTPPESTGNGKP